MIRVPPPLVLVIAALFGTVMAENEFGAASLVWGVLAGLAWSLIDRGLRGPPRNPWDP